MKLEWFMVPLFALGLGYLGLLLSGTLKPEETGWAILGFVCFFPFGVVAVARLTTVKRQNPASGKSTS